MRSAMLPALLPAVGLALLLQMSPLPGAGEARAQATQALGDVRAGNLAFKDGDLEKAVSAFTTAITSGTLGPDALAVTYNNRGVALGEIGEIDRAIADYLKALELLPGDPTTLKNLRVAYVRRGVRSMEAGKLEAAEADLDAAVDAEPGHPTPYVRRAEIRMRLGDLPGALADLEAARDRKADDPRLGDMITRLTAALQPEAERAAGTVVEDDGSGETLAGEPSAEADVVDAPGAETALLAVEPAVGGDAASDASDLAPATAPATAEASYWRAVAAVNVRAGPQNDATVVATIGDGARVAVVGEKLGWKEIVLSDGQHGFIYRKWLVPDSP